MYYETVVLWLPPVSHALRLCSTVFLRGDSRILFIETLFKTTLKRGYHRNLTEDRKYFTDAYLHRPEVFSSEVVEAGFQHQATLAVEGPAWLFESFENYWTDPALRLVVLDLIRKVEAEPS